MNNFDDIIKKSFEDQSLENESWLEPSDSVLGAIHEEIYPVEKTKRKFFWVWPFGILSLFLIILSIGVIKIFTWEKETFPSTDNSELINLPTDNKTPNSTNAVILSSSNKTDENIESNVTIDIPQKNNESYKKSAEILTPTFNVESVSNPTDNSKTSKLKQVNKKSDFINFKEGENDILSNLNINSNINQSLPIVSIDNRSSENNSKDKSLFNDHKTKEINTRTTFELSYLVNENISFIASNIKNEEIQIDRSIPYIPVRPSNKKKQSVVEFSTGFLNWNDQLNTNYQAALSPADFENSNDFGFQVGIAVKKEIISKLSAGVRLSYSQIENRSGHNAVLAYDETREVNGENNYESIQLATPYGFVNSSFNIKRSEAAAEPNASLNSSINSKHQIRIASVESLLNFNLLKLRKVSLNLEASLGYNHLIALNNDLDFINTNHDDFKFTSGEILVDQGNLRDGFWTTGLNVNLNYAFKPNASIGFNYGFREALSPLFSSGDFSSSPSTHQFNISFQRKF